MFQTLECCVLRTICFWGFEDNQNTGKYMRIFKEVEKIHGLARATGLKHYTVTGGDAGCGRDSGSRSVQGCHDHP